MSIAQLPAPIQPAELEHIHRLFNDQWFYSTQCYESNCKKNRLIKVCLGGSPNKALRDDLIALGTAIGNAYRSIPNLS